MQLVSGLVYTAVFGEDRCIERGEVEVIAVVQCRRVRRLYIGCVKSVELRSKDAALGDSSLDFINTRELFDDYYGKLSVFEEAVECRK